ncbi:hypothetical protein U27_01446 [Candidatus Vecturithrix granuli]|uniref:Uncharacterized protein n=1 Tax=Vecturithrix granuli TaxID=1499967 RepID=A0A081CAE0_VECG1|nr:hypothetical protein U27_01446 [Candidatus Vecturithrix granuli]
MKTLIKPWKGLKPLRRTCATLCAPGENPNKTLEGIKTIFFIHYRKGYNYQVKTLIKPWKGLKHVAHRRFFYGLRDVKTLIKPWKGLKHEITIATAHSAKVKTLIKPWKGLKPHIHRAYSPKE